MCLSSDEKREKIFWGKRMCLNERWINGLIIWNWNEWRLSVRKFDGHARILTMNGRNQVNLRIPLTQWLFECYLIYRDLNRTKDTVVPRKGSEIASHLFGYSLFLASIFLFAEQNIPGTNILQLFFSMRNERKTEKKFQVFF